ncbi:MAG: FKBP-type peptidyl-prolyl cis-trans isomerase [Thiomicrospira sp.]|uniref:FKBP-type peptidyl-prolyl cis-trans isomerase n=1 Tax=Thiomicrospira sp. TaxID=935 RepID=UPI0019F1BE4D|nr:FKBP-type peptidyl-prolyl cis-trans isomerase [Thiomicrospira sp.]MBE0494175.1 FKBP-type peptidyl-prolyl cis-trans isomerase [Thiomicrospira sp.]
MSPTPLVVQDNSEIGISFTLCLPDDTPIDQTEPGEIYRFKIGEGSLLANLEALLVGLEVGTQAKFFVPPEDGFGFPDPTNVYTMQRAEFPNDMALKVGDVVGFDTPTGDEVPGTVVKIQEDDITVDFNHPLAGQTFVFEVKIEAVYDSVS